MWITVLGSLFQLVLNLLSFRASSHPLDAQDSRDRRFRLYSYMSAIGLVITLIGVVLNQHSQNVEKEALNKELEANRKTITQSEQPYIATDGVGVQTDSRAKRSTIFVKVINTGRSDALNVRGFVALDRSKDAQHAELKYSKVDAKKSVTLRRGTGQALPAQPEISDTDLANWASGKDHMMTFLFGSVWYENAAGVETENAFCYHLTPFRFWEELQPKTCTGVSIYPTR